MAYLRARPPWGTATTAAEFEGTPIYQVPPAGWASGLGLKRIAREQPFDLVHAQHYGGATRAYLACRRYRLADGLRDPLAFGRRGRARQPGPRSCLQARTGRWKSASCATPRRSSPWVSRSSRSLVTEKGVPAERVSVIYPGIDLAEYDEPGPAGDDPRGRCRSTRSSCTWAASCIPTRACPS